MASHADCYQGETPAAPDKLRHAPLWEMGNCLSPGLPLSREAVPNRSCKMRMTGLTPVYPSMQGEIKGSGAQSGDSALPKKAAATTRRTKYTCSNYR